MLLRFLTPYLGCDASNKPLPPDRLVIRAADGTVEPPGELEVAKSGALKTGEYTLAAGTYKILCLIPGHENMKATLTVK